jgi:hypothetical protein
VIKTTQAKILHQYIDGSIEGNNKTKVTRPIQKRHRNRGKGEGINKID